MNVSSVALPNPHRFYAQALCAGGIGPDIIFTANIQDLNIALVDREECDEIICTGLVSDKKEKLEDYKILLDFFLNKKIPLICANPDDVVIRGDRIVFCAGALANQYKKEGGIVRYFGKPYAEIYNFALKKVSTHKYLKDKKKILY